MVKYTLFLRQNIDMFLLQLGQRASDSLKGTTAQKPAALSMSYVSKNNVISYFIFTL